MELILLSSVSTRKHSAQGVDEYSQQAGKDHAPSGKINNFKGITPGHIKAPLMSNLSSALDFI